MKTANRAAHAHREIFPTPEDFLDRSAARVFLKMPGCREIYVNDAHTRVFRVCLKSVSTATELKAATEEELRIQRTNEVLKDTRCYCYPMDAIVALISRHCVFERSFDALKEGENERHVDIAAFRVPSDGGRTYQLFVMRSRRFEGDYLESEFTKLAGLRVVVTTEREENGFPVSLRARTTLGDVDFIPVEPLDVKDAKEYRAVHEAIGDAMKQLQEVSGLAHVDQEPVLAESKRNLLEVLRGHREIEEYEAVVGFVNGIYGPVTGSNRQKGVCELLEELQQIRERLFDANVVMDEVVHRILEKIEGWPEVEL